VYSPKYEEGSKIKEFMLLVDDLLHVQYLNTNSNDNISLEFVYVYVGWVFW
jgi:hypothetical protein